MEIHHITIRNYVLQVFHVVSFEAYYRNHSEKLSEGFIIPTRNVATMKFGATVTEGVSRYVIIFFDIYLHLEIYF